MPENMECLSFVTKEKRSDICGIIKHANNLISELWKEKDLTTPNSLLKSVPG